MPTFGRSFVVEDGERFVGAHLLQHAVDEADEVLVGVPDRDAVVLRR